MFGTLVVVTRKSERFRRRSCSSDAPANDRSWKKFVWIDQDCFWVYRIGPSPIDGIAHSPLRFPNCKAHSLPPFQVTRTSSFCVRSAPQKREVAKSTFQPVRYRCIHSTTRIPPPRKLGPIHRSAANNTARSRHHSRTRRSPRAACSNVMRFVSVNSSCFSILPTKHAMSVMFSRLT